jgi:hypothetical protein
MKNKFVFLIASVFLFAFSQAYAQTQVVNLTTGSSGSVGDPDPIWTQVVTPGLTTETPRIPGDQDGTYGTNSCGQWISPAVNTTPGPNFGTLLLGVAGDYIYEMSFTRAGSLCAVQATLNILFAGGDNDLVSISINGTPFELPGTVAFNPLTSLTSINVPSGLILPGTNTVRATVHNASTYTAFFLCGNLTIVSGGQWNVTTENATNGGDQGNNIVVDENGDMYIAGTFKQHAEFPHLTCAGSVITGDANPSAYIAKYSRCGTLIWVNYDAGTGFSEGTGLAYDSQRNLVYMAGLEGGSGIAFHSTAATPCGTAASSPVSSATQHYYIAKFDAFTGGFINIYHHTVPSATSVKSPVSIDLENVNATTTNLFAVIAFTRSIDDLIHVTHVLDAGGTYSTPWITNTGLTSTSSAKTVNDIALDPASSRVYITGKFSHDLQFLPATLATSCVSDAYVWEFNSTTGLSLAGKKLNVSGASGEAAGTGLTLGQGGIYATGYFNSDITGVFGSSTSNFTGGLPGFRSYVVKFASGLGVTWASQIRGASGSSVKATGIGSSISQTSVAITGTITGNITFPGIMTANGGYTSATAGAPKMFNACYISSGGSMWANATVDNVANSVHTSTKNSA